MPYHLQVNFPLIKRIVLLLAWIPEDINESRARVNLGLWILGKADGTCHQFRALLFHPRFYYSALVQTR